MELKEKDVKFKDIIILRKQEIKKKVAQAANKNIKLVDDLVDFIKSCLKNIESFFKDNKDILSNMNEYFKTKPTIENKNGQTEIYRLFRKYPDVILNTDCKTTFDKKFKRDIERMEEINENYRKNTQMVIGNFATSGQFDEKTILSAMNDAEKEIQSRKDEFSKKVIPMFVMMNLMLNAAHEVKNLNPKN